MPNIEVRQLFYICSFILNNSRKYNVRKLQLKIERKQPDKPDATLRLLFYVE